MYERALRVPSSAVAGPQIAAPPRTRRRVVVQRKLTVGAVDDPAEREADRMADEVLSAVRSTDVVSPQMAESTRIARSVRRSVRAGTGFKGGDLDSEMTNRIRSSAGGGSALDAGTQSSMESAFGASFGSVRVHRDSDLAPSINARAFTAGADIHFAPGEYTPGSASGQRLLAHELAHVVQQGDAVRGDDGENQRA
jgi:hypothetical protein